VIAVRDHDGRLGVPADPDHELAPDEVVGRLAVQPDHDRFGDLGLGRDVEERRSAGELGGERRGPVVGGELADLTRLGGTDRRQLHPVRDRGVPRQARVGRLAVEDAAQPLERREAPDLLTAGRDLVVGDVEGAHGVEVAVHPVLLGALLQGGAD